MNKNEDFTQRDEYTIGMEKDSSPGAYYHITNENIEDEVAPSEVNLDSFKIKSHLPEEIWKDENTLSLRVRDSLLDIADDFWETCNIRWIKPITAILTGSICNYTWSEFSDIDLHIIVDFKKIHKNTDFVQEYFDEKKNAWNNEHKSLTIYGYNVELYVQDKDYKSESNIIYDLYKNRWIKKPNKKELLKTKPDSKKIKLIASKIMTIIDDLYEDFNNETDEHRISKLSDACYKLLNKIKKLRKDGLEKGELGDGNIIYKVLRRTGYLDMLWEIQSESYDKINSIRESISFKNKIKKQFS
jgi:hypothetical protein